MSVRPEDAFRRAVSRRDLLQGSALVSHLLSATSVLLAAATLVCVAALFNTWLRPASIDSANPQRLEQLVLLLSNTHLSIGLLALTAGTVFWILHRSTSHLADSAAQTVARGISDRLRRAMFRQHLRIGPGDVDGCTGESVRKRLSEDIAIVSTATLDTLGRLGRDTMTAATCLVLALLADPILALQCLLLPAALLGWLVIRDRAARNRHRLAVDDLAQTTDQQIHESFSQVRLACGYSTDRLAQDRLDASLADAGQLATARDSRHILGRAIRGSLKAIAAAVILALVSRRLLDTPPPDSLNLPSALILVVSIAGLLRALDRRGELQRIAEQAGRAAERIHEYLDRVPHVSQAVGARFLEPLADEIRFESVTWQTDDATPTQSQTPSLKGLDLVIPAGETTALLSVDPREARAVAWLLARFIDPHGGRIVIDGQDIATGTLESLRAEVLVVAGDGDCFAGSVLDNICCGRPEGGLSRATEAAKAVRAHHFISKLPNGYETKLGSDDVRLDAGQAYRIGLARALARNPALLVIEEPATPMDADTKSLLDDTYDRITTGRTVIFLPNRLSTVRRANRVVLVHDGQVAETGQHEDLVRTSELYRHWEYTRFNAFGTHTLPSPAGH